MKMKSRRPETHPQRLNIIPLIDVVFMLMAFLLMTFKIGAPEGDFEVSLAHSGAGSSVALTQTEQPAENVHIRMTSDSDGNLTGIKVGDREFGPDSRLLRAFIVRLLKNVPEEKRGQWQAEIEFDRPLRYQYTMDAISAVRGHYVGNDFVTLIEKINVMEKR